MGTLLSLFVARSLIRVNILCSCSLQFRTAKLFFSSCSKMFNEKSAENCAKIKEGKVEIIFPDANSVFYNPVQEFNRDIT